MKNKVTFLAVIGILFLVEIANAGQWALSLEGSGSEHATSIRQTADGGFIAAGYTNSFGGGNWDAWVAKLDAYGYTAWEKTYGGSGIDAATSVQQTQDGGYIVAGYTSSYGAGNYDAWVLKLNADGTIAWQKTYGGSNADYANSIQQTADGGYIVAGYTYSFGAGNNDAWVIASRNTRGDTTMRKAG